MNLFRSRLHPFRFGLLLCGFVAAGSVGSPTVRAQALDQQTTSDTPSQATLPSPANVTTTNPLNQLNQNQTPQTNETEAQRQARLAVEEQQLQTSQTQPLLPPEPPSPFQQMVEATTGEKLEVYGASLFRRVPTTFAPVQNVPVGPGYVLGPGDQIDLQLAGQVNRQLILVIDRDGSIQLPELGAVHVAGLTYGDLRDF